MRMPGYCTSCHRVRQVTVSGPMVGRTPSGICADCERKERDAPKLRLLIDALLRSMRREVPDDESEREHTYGFNQNLRLLHGRARMAGTLDDFERELRHGLIQRGTSAEANNFNRGALEAWELAVVFIDRIKRGGRL